MATVKVKFQCGCGYQTKNVEEAVKHSDEKHHSLTVLGTIEKK